VGTIDGNLVRSLVLAVVALGGLAPHDASAAAQGKDGGPASPADEEGEEGAKDRPAGPADEEGEEGAKDRPASPLEEGEEGDKPGWKLSASLNPAMLVWDDGTRGVRFVDNAQDSSGISLEGRFKLGQSWTAGVKFGLDTMYASSDSVDQRDRDGDGLAVELADALFEIGHEEWGTVVLGHGDSASDETNNITLTGSDVVADAEVNNWNNNFFLRLAGTGLARGGGEGSAKLRWGDFLEGPLAGETGRFITYVTPEVMGLEAAVSVGQPEDIRLVKGRKWFEERTGGIFTDVGLRYSGSWGSVFRVKAGIGAWRDTTEEKDAEESTKDTGWGGSLAVMHVPTGLNIAFDYGTESHAGRCAEPGAVTGKCPDDDRFIYVQGGIIRDFFEWGPTALYGEYYRGWIAQHETDEDVLRTLERNPGQAEELKSSVATMWGLGVVHTSKAASTRAYTTDLYLGYRHYGLDLNLIGAGGSVPARKVNDLDIIMAGVRFRWGGRGND